MSEQVATSEPVNDIWGARNREHIEGAVQRAGYAEVYLGTLATDTGNFDRYKTQIKDRIDSLLRMFDIDPGEWEREALKLTYDSRSYEKERFKEDIARMKRERPLGAFLADSAVADLDIEGLEDGIGGVELAYMLSPSLMALFRAGGDFWTTREFIDSRTSQVTDETNDRVLLAELEVEHGPMIADSRADYQLSFSVHFSALDFTD
jgi:hypothetical protein